MAAAIGVRSDHTSTDLRRFARQSGDTDQVRRLLAVAVILDGGSHGIGEYVCGNAHTNTIEGYFSILKRGIIGTYHHVSAEHLKRYLAEFDFRYNQRTALGVSDEERVIRSIPGIVGKRLTYRRTGREGAAVRA